MANIMVCVTLQSTCQKLIDVAVAQKKENDKLYVLHVAKTGNNFFNVTDEGAMLEFLYNAALNAGADMTVKHSDNVKETIVDFIKENDINTVILGKPQNNSKDSGLIHTLSAELEGKCSLLLIEKT